MNVVVPLLDKELPNVLLNTPFIAFHGHPAIAALPDTRCTPIAPDTRRCNFVVCELTHGDPFDLMLHASMTSATRRAHKYAKICHHIEGPAHAAVHADFVVVEKCDFAELLLVLLGLSIFHV